MHYFNNSVRSMRKKTNRQ